MAAKISRKPNRKSMIKSDVSRHANESVELSRLRRSTEVKRDVVKMREKATAKGIVVGTSGTRWLVVDIDRQESENGMFTHVRECIPGGIVMSNNDDDTLICVGDVVTFSEQDGAGESEDRTGVIVEVEKRTSRLLRKTAGERTHLQCLASNVLQCCIVQAAAEPFYNKRLIDRYIISIEQGGMKPVIIVNKIELMDRDFVSEDLSCYRRLRIPVILSSCATGEGLDVIRETLAHSTSMLAGPSGVGKSSIINACFGMDLQRVREISAKYDKGKHTTTGARIFTLPEGGRIVDTPGIREFAICDLHVDDLSYYFHDFDAYYPDCKYLPCTHTHEPGCRVREAVESGLIDAGRYESYVRIRESMLV